MSFPPFPSYVLLPFALFFGSRTPDALIALAVALYGLWHALHLTRTLSGGQQAVPRVLYLLLANGYVFLCINGWVWFFAQNFCFALSLAAIDHAVHKRGGLSLALWACAVGCRPMVLLYGPLLLWVLLRDAPEGFPRALLRRACWLIAPALLGASYMALNLARFGSVLEFGHNSLPEMVRAGGQFSLSWLPANLLQLLRPIGFGEGGRMLFPIADAMPFYLGCPLILSALGCRGRRLLRREGDGFGRALLLLTLAYVLILCCHHTLGAWQFGARYLVDILPWLYWGTLLWEPDDLRFNRRSLPLFILGAAMNLTGTVALYNHWLTVRP